VPAPRGGCALSGFWKRGITTINYEERSILPSMQSTNFPLLSST
jgi:hypothetical protein